MFNWNNGDISKNNLPQKNIFATKSGLDNTGKNDNSKQLQSLIDQSPTDSQTIILFEEGIYKFSKTVNLKSNITIEGKGAKKTKFIFDNGGTGNLFEVSCIQKNQFCKLNRDVKAKTANFYFDSTQIEENWYLEILIDANGLATSDWAMQSIGQIVKVKAAENKSVLIYGNFKLDFLTKSNLRYRRIIPISDVNFKFFSIERKDKTTGQTNNINFNYAVNCTVKGVESYNSNMSHIAFSKSYNCTVRDCYIHHAFDYGGGGKAYGVELSNTSSVCMIENNIFENLRHSILLQSGANGNIISGNFSKNPNWTEALLPANSAGEIVLHGNYPFANLIEQNQVGNIVVDNSHGINGPGNVFFRNRASLWGVFMNNGSGDKTHFIANEITGSLCNFAGNGNVTQFNYRKISDTSNFTKIKIPKSLYYDIKPEWWQQMIEFPLIGTPKSGKIENITSFYRNNFDSLKALNTSADVFILNSLINKQKISNDKIIIEFESNMQVNVCSIYLQSCQAQSGYWQNISENFANKYLFQKYKYSDTLSLNSQSCFRFEALGYNGIKWQGDTFCFAPVSSISNEVFDEKIKIYPNPFCEKINVLSSEKSDLKILDLGGKTLVSYNILPNTNSEISTQNLSKGVYLLLLESKSKSLKKTLIKN